MDLAHDQQDEYKNHNKKLFSRRPSLVSITDNNSSWDVNGNCPVNHDLNYDSNNGNRKKWRRRADFILMLVGYTIGLGNVWKFPYLCHENGGVTFLIPYFIMLIVEGIPLYYMELCIGQRLQKGTICVWHSISPYLDGVGIASAAICFLVCLYYNVILSWCLVYFINSFKDPLPWSFCPKIKRTIGNVTREYEIAECTLAGPTKYFWYRTTLDVSGDIEDGGGFNWTLCLSLLVTWVVCWLCMVRGIRSEGKVVYITATLPLILLGLLFFRGVHLTGFQDGLGLLFIPNFTRLKDHKVWLDAAGQMFYSLGVAYGSLICFASYNPLKNDTTKDAVMICLIDAGVSIYASVVIFCFIGYRAHIKMLECQNTTAHLHQNHFRLPTIYQSARMYSGHNSSNYIGGSKSMIRLLATTLSTANRTCNKEKFLMETSQKTGLAFITFTEAINSLPHSQMWCILFFLMLLILGMDTQFGMLEGVMTPVLDAKLFPNVRVEVKTGIICLILYVLGFTMVQHSGNYWLQLIDSYCSGVPLLVIALVECVSISYLYGIPQFTADIEYMTNKKPRFIWVICWKVVSPLIIIIILLVQIVTMMTNTPKYEKWNKKEGKEVMAPLPAWAIFTGVLLMLASVVWIPLIAFFRHIGWMKRVEPKSVRIARSAAEMESSENGHMLTVLET